MTDMAPSILICDTETTGIHAPIGVCQLAAVLLVPDDEEGLTLVPAFQTYCVPSAPMSPKALETHGITPDKYELMPGDAHAAWVLEALLGGLGQDVVLSGYNSKRYDYPVLSALLPSLGELISGLRQIDVMHLCIRRDDGQGYKLVEAFQQEGLSQTPEGQKLLKSAHDAMADCWMTALLLKEFMRQLGTYNAYEVADYLDEPQALTLMPHGQHRGKPFEQVPLSYLQWAAGKWTDMAPDLEASFKRLGLR